MIGKLNVLVPRFTNHFHTTADLDIESWHEIFDQAISEKAPKKIQHLPFYRKIVTVRLASKDAFYIPVDSIRGILDNTDLPFRKVYGEILFHTRHERDSLIPYQMPVQLTVRVGGVIYQGEICSVSLYITERTRFSEELYAPVNKSFVEYRMIGKKEVDDELDYSYGLRRTKKMYEWVYCCPPHDGNWDGPFCGNKAKR